ncbi:MAG TPA: class E sortase [Candidatus Angelobacter sp.]|nr:class E sortase [Candidatus Angelobacter sp.]
MALGGALVVAGIVIIAVPLVGTWLRGHADDQALRDWNSGGASALAGAAPSSDPGPQTGATPLADASPSATAAQATPAPCRPNAAPADDYALVGFPTLAQYGYSGVAANGDWNTLHQRSMVHYSASPAPGAQGNAIVAFHREPHYEHIDQLHVGDAVTVQDRSCMVFTYRVTERWTLPPDKVTQLTATGGHDLTLITCTPWWRDNERIVWRATLVEPSPAAH